MTGEHVRGVRDTGPYIEARELVPLIGLVLMLIGLLWARTAKLVPSDPALHPAPGGLTRFDRKWIGQ